MSHASQLLYLYKRKKCKKKLINVKYYLFKCICLLVDDDYQSHIT